MTLKHHMAFQMNVNRQNKARRDDLGNENTLPKLPGCWKKKYCRTKCPSEENLFDDEMRPFAVSIREGEKRYRLGQEFLLPRKFVLVHVL